MMIGCADMTKLYNVEENASFNNSLDILAHYGVAGMRWGVRNDETLRKYGLSKKNITKSTNKSNSNTKKSNIKTKVSDIGKKFIKRISRKPSPKKVEYGSSFYTTNESILSRKINHTPGLEYFDKDRYSQKRQDKIQGVQSYAEVMKDKDRRENSMLTNLMRSSEYYDPTYNNKEYYDKSLYPEKRSMQTVTRDR